MAAATVHGWLGARCLADNCTYNCHLDIGPFCLYQDVESALKSAAKRMRKHCSSLFLQEHSRGNSFNVLPDQAQEAWEHYNRCEEVDYETFLAWDTNVLKRYCAHHPARASDSTWEANVCLGETTFAKPLQFTPNTAVHWPKPVMVVHRKNRLATRNKCNKRKASAFQFALAHAAIRGFKRFKQRHRAPADGPAMTQWVSAATSYTKAHINIAAIDLALGRTPPQCEFSPRVAHELTRILEGGIGHREVTATITLEDISYPPKQ